MSSFPHTEDITRESPRRPRFIYARILKALLPSAFTLCALSFLLYLSGLVAPLVALRDMHTVWKLDAASALRATGLTPGWSWLSHWYASDMLCMIALALLAAVTPIACAFTSVQYFRRNERALGLIALLQFIILTAAMSGILVP